MNNQPILAYTCGVPGSGKTTVAQRLVDEAGFTHISRDVVRNDGGDYCPEKEVLVTQEIKSRTFKKLRDCQKVVIDCVNHLIWQRARYRIWAHEFFGTYDVEIPVVCVYTPAPDIKTILARRQEKIKENPGLGRWIESCHRNIQVPQFDLEHTHVFITDALTSQLGPIWQTKGWMPTVEDLR